MIGDIQDNINSYKDNIKYVRRNPRITLCELWAKLKREKGYTRTMDKRFYQYTYIDEATRERFLYWYEEHTPANTVDFIYRVIKYFGYKPKEKRRELEVFGMISYAV